jgi:predicted MFS family arabinose efflux permease
MASVRSAAPHVTLAVALIGFSSAWNAGNVGPVVDEIASGVDLSLAAVGLLAGTFFLGATVVGLLVAARVGERVGLVHGLRIGCSLLVVGNLIFAVSPGFVGLAIGRILPGLGFALANTFGAVWARESGGVRLLGIFGASIQLGIAIALLSGSALSDLGVGWRIGFVLSAALAVAAFVAIPADAKASIAAKGGSGFLRAAMRHARVYRLALLFIAIYGVPMILSAWLIEYLTSEADLAKTVAGTASFLLFGLSAVMRVLGAQLEREGVRHAYLAGTLGLAAVGLAALTLDPVAAVAFAGVTLLALGFGVPYTIALTEAQELYPEEPSEPVALMTLVALVPPVVATPIVGRALETGDAEFAFGILAVFILLAAAANLRPTGIPLTAAAEQAT